MRQVLRWLSVGLLTVAAAGLVLFAALWVGTRGTYSVPALVTGDPTLSAAEIGGVRLHLRIVEGPPGAGTVIVLHGGPGGDFRSLQALAALSDTRRVVFYDQRGAGLSERVAAEALTLDGHLAELAAVIDHVARGQQVSLIGHSWGAMLAAAYLGQDPARIGGAVLIEPGYLDAAGRALWQREARRFLSGPAYAGTAVLTGFRSMHIDGPDPQARADFLIGRMVRAFVDHPETPYHCGDGYTAPSWRFGALSSETWSRADGAAIDRIGAGAKAYEGPVLLMAGACDDWLGAPLQTRHLRRFSDARLAVIEAAGHDVVWDNPEAALAAIRSFLDGATVRTRP